MEDNMKFKIPKIIRPLEMSAYAEEMEGLALQVWVNPPRKVKDKYSDLQVEIVGLKIELDKMLAQKKAPAQNRVDALDKKITANNTAVFEWYANILSQASDPDTHVDAEELKTMADEDPAIYTFITTGAWELITVHVENIRKN